MNSRDSIWMLADRRLSYRNRPPNDNGRKLMFLETSDGVAMLGYAGLGATAKGTEPADWMNAVLRGQNLSLEKCLGILTKALRHQFPKHLRRFPVGASPIHNILIPSFVEDEVRLYMIDLALVPDRNHYTFSYTRCVAGSPPQTTPRVALAGSGATCLLANRRWIRPLLHLIKASDEGKISPYAVADRLATINQYAYKGTRDGSVGSRCIVGWRYRKLGARGGGGGHQYYDGEQRSSDSKSLPMLASGTDITALVSASLPHIIPRLQKLISGEPEEEVNTDLINAELGKLSWGPDEDLK